MTAGTNREPDGGGGPDRVRPPSATVARLRPYFRELGITRLARQTNLDVLGIPCFAAIRPNSRSLACHYGKGISDDAAMVSAVMEAAEMAFAERAIPISFRGDAATLKDAGMQVFDVSRFLPFGETLADDAVIDWTAGRALASARPVMVPTDLLRMTGRARGMAGLCQTSNGLAAGNIDAEAELHGLLELVERDATTGWTLSMPDHRHARCFSIDSVDGPIVGDLAARVRRAGFVVSLFDLTNDIGIPTVMALVGPADATHHREVTAGYATHPLLARAVAGAVTEAAQSRLTLIAGARDDQSPAAYDLPVHAEDAVLLGASARRNPPPDLGPVLPPDEALGLVLGALRAASVADPVAVRLGGDCYGISVVRMLSEDLEDRGANANWRPGARSVSTLLRAA
ncbi:MAG: YcaO-like family protein [Devosia sp.]|nr:YcaO-like family protein [Devosia sp.]